MPWTETCAMKERFDFIAEHSIGEAPMSALCLRYGISRKTGYKWLSRHIADPGGSLEDRSRAPKTCPHRTPPESRDLILSLKSTYPFWGPKKLKAFLERNYPDFRCPAASTIGEILAGAGLTRSRRRRRETPPHEAPLSHATAPNRVWCIDFKGWFCTGDGVRVDPLTITDAASRYLVRLVALEAPRREAVWPILDSAFREFGLPDRLRSDNGTPFASCAAGGLSRLSVALIKAGVIPERIDPGRPDQNGRHERMHRVLKEETASPPACSWRAQAARFAEFRRVYNHLRPHEALGQKPPASLYTPSARAWHGRFRSPEYEAGVMIRKVGSRGDVKFQGRKVFVCEALYGEPVALEEVACGRWSVRYGPVPLGWIEKGKLTRPARREARRRQRNAEKTTNDAN